MVLFEFITVMISVLLALAAAQLLLGLAPLLQTRHQVHLSGTHGAWVASLFLIIFLHWWSLWDFRDLDWTFPMFALSLVGPALLFFAATLINPRDTSSDPIDLAQHFRDVRRPFLIVIVLAMVFLTVDGPMFGTEPPVNRLRFAQAGVTGLAGLGIASSSDRVHAIVGILIVLTVLLATTSRLLPGTVL